MNDSLKDAARLFAAKDYAAAEAVCRSIIDGDAGHFDALHLLGVVLTLQERPDDALVYLRRAEVGLPDNLQLRQNLGNALLAAERFEDVIALPAERDPASFNNLGLAYRGLKRWDDAAEAFRAATAVRWDFAPAWFNLATTLSELDRPLEALDAARQAQRVAPLDTPLQRQADVVSEIGRLLAAIGQPEAALAECERFLRVHPEQPSVGWNKSLCLLLLGRFEEGWRAYESRFGVGDHGPRPDGASVLDPSRVAGRRVLLLTEQGRGDMMQFVRYAPLLAALGATVLIQTYPDLVALFSTIPGVVEVASNDDPRPEADLVTPMMSLPLAFGIQPANVPYLFALESRSFDLGERTRPRIGIAWSGSAHSYQRSAMPAEALAPLLALAGFEFHCLQQAITPADRLWLEASDAAIRLQGERLADFADTAALIGQMDGVISVDTAVAHLAGAMGKPVEVMLPFNPDWRWLLGRADSPWYPAARLHRQPERGAWAPVVESVIAALTGRFGAG